MATYLVTPKDRRTPPARFSAPDLVALGEQVATYLTRRRVLLRGAGFYAQIGDDRGAISQDGHTVTFDITQES